MLCLFNCEEEWPYFNKNNKKEKKNKVRAPIWLITLNLLKHVTDHDFVLSMYMMLLFLLKCIVFFHWGKSVLAYFFFLLFIYFCLSSGELNFRRVGVETTLTSLTSHHNFYTFQARIKISMALCCHPCRVFKTFHLRTKRKKSVSPTENLLVLYFYLIAIIHSFAVILSLLWYIGQTSSE